MKLDMLRDKISNAKYVVCLCGAEMYRECGYLDMGDTDRFYDLEIKYGYSPEEIFLSSFFISRKEQFFEFYRNEVLQLNLNPNDGFYALEKLQQQGKLGCVITNNNTGIAIEAGCRNVVELYGSIHKNTCPKCQREYPVEYIKYSKKIPLCETCGAVIRPGIVLYGEMLDISKMTKAADEIAKADLLLLLGANLKTGWSERYIKYFEGKCLAVINPEEHYTDIKADIVIHDKIENVLPVLVC